MRKKRDVKRKKEERKNFGRFRRLMGKTNEKQETKIKTASIQK